MKIAVVGMSFQFPGELRDEVSLWKQLEAGADLVREIPEQRRALFPRGAPDFPKRAGWLSEVAGFDASFFGFNGLEARYTDPQQRLVLESVWAALEDAAMNPGVLAGNLVGVFVGAHSADYHELAVRENVEVNAYWNPGLNGAVLANRISYFFDFRGPSVTLNTACSSSLEAVVQACRNIQDGVCELAVAAAVSLILTPSVTLGAARAGMLAPDGRCKAFDARADGFVRGEGVAALILKPLAQALADGDPIHGVVRAAESGHGGRANSFTAPNARRQTELIKHAWRDEDLPITSAGLIETHGTGTRLGDCIEIEALKDAFADLLGGQTWNAPLCGLGSIKTNIGHLEAAAGLAGIVKALLAMKRGRLPGMVHFQQLNPLLDLSQSPFFVTAQNTDWPEPDQGPRRAGVSSFGFGGSSAHLVLEEAPPPPPQSNRDREKHLILLSARNPERLAERVDQLVVFLRTEQGSNTSLARLAHSLCVGRQAMASRLVIWVTDREQLLEILKGFPNHQGVASVYKKPRRGGLRLSRPKNPVPPDGDWKELASRWLQGENLDWSTAGPAGMRRLCLPTYPFHHKRYWITDPVE